MTREELILSVDHFAIKMAKAAWSKCSWAELDDFVQAARLGVAVAVDDYNPEKGAFTTWAFYHIRKQVQDLYMMNLPTYVPSRAYAEMSKEDRARLYHSGLYLSAPVKATDGETVLEDILADTATAQKWDGIERRKTLRAIVNRAFEVSNTTPREQQILRAVYGLGEPPVTQVEIGDRLGVTRQRTGQLLSTAHTKIRRALLRVVGKEASLLAYL